MATTTKNDNNKVVKSKLVGGSGGGKGSSGSESSDTLKSTALLSTIDLLSEGQIGGIVDNSPSSVFLNDTPIATKDGDYNFDDVTWAVVTGQQDQDVLGDGFNAVEAVVGVNTKVSYGKPVVFTVTDPNATAVRVIMATPSLLSTDKKGNTNGSSVSFGFEVSVNGGEYEPVGGGKITGKSRTRYQRAYIKDLPTQTVKGEKATTWTIRVNRNEPDSSDSSTSNDLYVDSYSTIIDTRLTYPNSALFGLQVGSDQFSSEPSRSYLIDGLLIKVPVNRDSKTREYTGVWNGNFKLEVCDNPAWILYDIITNERYGLGQYVPALYANAARLYEIGKYCDEMIDDGFGIGKLEPRFTINTAITSLVDAYQLISDITSTFNGMAYWTGNSIGYMADMPTPVSMIYSAANVINGEFTYQGSSRKDRHSVVLVRYNDPERNYETQTEYIEDSELIERFGVRKTEISAFGCTTRGQAHRVGKWLLYTEKYQSSAINFSVGIDSALVMPGDVIQIVDANRSGKRNGGRLVSCTLTSAIIDDDITIDADSFIFIRLANGTLAERYVASSRSVTVGKRKLKEVTWTSPLASLPVANAMWQINSPELNPITARVVSVGQGENAGEFSISAIEHNPSKFDHIEKDILLEKVNITQIDPLGSIQPTASVKILGEKIIDQDSTRYSLNISWEQVKDAKAYIVKYRKENGNWVEMPTQTGLSVDVQGIYSGVYEASVQAISAQNSKSRVTYSNLTNVEGSASILPKIASLVGKSLAFSIGLSWVFGENTTGVKYTQLEQSLDYDVNNPAAANWMPLTHEVYPSTEYTLTGLTTIDRRFFRARVVDGFDQYGEWSDVIAQSASSDIESMQDVLAGQIGEGLLDQALTGKLDSTNDTANKALAEARAEAEKLKKEIADRAAAIASEAQARIDGDTAEALARTSAIAAASKASADELLAKATELTGNINAATDTALQEVRNEAAERKRTVDLERSERIYAIEQMQTGYTKQFTEVNAANAATLQSLENYKLEANGKLVNHQQKIDLNTSNIASQAEAISALDVRVDGANSTAASAVDKVTTVATTQTSQAESLKKLEARLTAAEGAIETGMELDTSIFDNFVTKADANGVIAQQITEFNAGLKIGGTNFLQNSEAPRSATAKEYLLYEKSAALQQFYKDNPEVTISFDISVKVAGPIQVYCSNSTGMQFSATVNVDVVDKFVRKAVVVKPVPHANTPNLLESALEFYGVYESGRFFTVRKVQLEAGNKATAWRPSFTEIQTAVSANANAINDTKSRVDTIDGKVTATVQDLSSLTTKVNDNQTAVTGEITTVKKTVTDLDKSVNQSIDRLQSNYEGLTVSASPNLWVHKDSAVKDGGIKNNDYTYTISGAMPFGGCSFKMAGLDLPTDISLVFSYKLKVISGTVTIIGGHVDGLSMEEVYIDGAKLTVATNTTTWTLPTALIAGKELDVVVKYKRNSVALGDIWIQPNRTLTTEHATHVSQVQLEIGKARTPWKLAIEDENARLDVKVDASVLNNYYTKADADTATASKIEQFNAELSIGGDNLLKNTGPIVEDSQYWVTAVPTGIVASMTVQENGFHTEMTGETRVGTASWIYDINQVLELNESITLSVTLEKVTGDVVSRVLIRPQFEDGTYGASEYSPFTAQLGRMHLTYTNSTELRVTAIRIWLASNVTAVGLSGSALFKKPQLELGNKATAWRMGSDSIKDALDVNANAINTTNTEVSRIDGVLTSTANSLSTLSSTVSSNAKTLDGKITSLAETVSTNNSNSSSRMDSLESNLTKAQNTANGAVTAAANAQSTANTAVTDGKATANSLNALSSKFDRSAVAGNNLLINSNVIGLYDGSYPHQMYTLTENFVVGEKYTLLWCGEHKRGTGDTYSRLVAYAGGALQNVSDISSEYDTGVTIRKTTFTKNSSGLDNTMRFYCIGRPAASVGTVATVYWAVLVKGDVITTDQWIPSAKELLPDLNKANADFTSAVATLTQADKATTDRVTELTTTVSNNKATSDSRFVTVEKSVSTLNSSMTSKTDKLTSDLAALSGTVATKANASVLKDYYTITEGDKAIAREISAFESQLVLGGNNLIDNSDLVLSVKGSKAGLIWNITPSELSNKTLTMSVNVKVTNVTAVAASGYNRAGFEGAAVSTTGAVSYIGTWQTFTSADIGKSFDVRLVTHIDLSKITFASLVNPSFHVQGITADAVEVSKPKIEFGTVASAWGLSENDIQKGAVASAKTYTDSETKKVGDRITSEATRLDTLNAAVGNIRNYQLSSCGWTTTANPRIACIRDLTGKILHGVSRGIALFSFDSNNNVVTSDQYDTYANVANATALAERVAAFADGTYVAVLTYDTIINGLQTIIPALTQLGGSAATLNQVKGRDAYILVGRKGLAEGGGIEIFAPYSSGDGGSKQIDYMLQMINGTPVGLGASSPYANVYNSLTAKVDEVAGVATTTATKQESLEARTANVETKASDAELIARAMPNAKLLFGDPQFKQGTNGVVVYDNARTGRVKVERVARWTADNPTKSTHQLNITVTAGSSPEYGGFLQQVQSRPNAVFLWKYVLKLPVGYRLKPAANSMGTGYTDSIVGNDLGTGKYETYYRILRCGDTGSFSNGGHVFVGPVGSAMLTGTQTMTFPLAQIECYDLTDWADNTPALDETFAAYDNSIKVLTDTTKAQADSITTLTSRVNNKAEASALNNYYTKAQADSATSGQIQEFKSNLLVGGTNECTRSTESAAWGMDGGTTAVRQDNVVDADLKTTRGMKFTTSGGTGTLYKAVRTVSGLKLGTTVTMSFSIKNVGSVPFGVRCNGIEDIQPNSTPTYATVPVNAVQQVVWSGRTRSAYDFIQMITQANTVTDSISFIVCDFMVVYGSVPSSWSPSAKELEGKVTNNAEAISNTYTKTEANNVIATQLNTFKTSVVAPSIADAMKDIKTDSVSIPDTRFNNQPPQWYWTNYPVRVVTEFKEGKSIGSPAGVAGYGVMTTIVPWTDSTGSPIIQEFKSSSDLNTMYRYSSGSGAAATWTAWSSELKTQTAKITETATTVNGIKALKTVVIDNNGVMSGYGLVSDLVNGKVTSTFGINADNFYIGAPSSGKKPFIVTTAPKVVNGVTYPAGTWIDSAYIANATIKLAHIDKASITSLSALSGTFGRIETSVTGKGKTVMTGSGIEIYDAAGTMRVFIGVK